MDHDSPKLQQKLSRFVCQRCNECCKKPGFVYLVEGEAANIASFLKQSEFDFVNEFCEIEERQKLVLKKYPDESCIFLTSEGCKIHSVKPQQCRDFPIKWRTPASLTYCEGLKKLS